MKIFKLMTLFLMLNSSLFGETHEGRFKYLNLQYGGTDYFDVNIEVKYKLWTLFGDPVINTVARYTLGKWIYIDNKMYLISSFPKEVINKVKLYNLELEIFFKTEYRSGGMNLFIDSDMGAMGNVGEWSFNTPESPNWSKWIYINQNNDGKKFLSKKVAIEAYKGFKRLGLGQNNGIFVKNMKFDVTAIKKYLIKKKLENETKNLEEKYQEEVADVKRESEKLNDAQKEITTQLKKRYGNEQLCTIVSRIKKEGNPKELAILMKALDTSKQLSLRQNPLLDKIGNISMKYNQLLKKYEDKYLYTLLEIDQESNQINRFIDEKIEELKNRKLPEKSKVVEGDDVWMDSETGLIWQDNEMAKTNRLSWYDAKSYCETLVLSGYDNWRLPSKGDLTSLYPKKDNLKNVVSDDYWSSSTVVGNEDGAWNVYFGYGYDVWNDKLGSFYVRCVRDGQ